MREKGRNRGTGREPKSGYVNGHDYHNHNEPGGRCHSFANSVSSAKSSTILLDNDEMHLRSGRGRTSCGV